MTQKLEDSGERRTFSTGAVRDRGDLKPRPDLISPHAQLREGMIMTLGGVKYALRNWEQGMPISECLASAQRHIEQYKLGETNEDHIAQARWNLGAVIHFEEEIKAGRMDPTIDDMPKYAKPLPPCPRCDSVMTPCDCPETGPECYCKTCGLTSLDVWPPEDGRESNYDVIGRLYADDSDVTGRPITKARIFTPTFYIAGPMRGHDDLNFPAFDAARDRGIALGYNIISPADMDREHGIDPTDGPCVAADEYDNLSPMILHGIVERDVGVIMSLRPEREDGVAVLPGYQHSIGARAEVALASWLGLRIVWASDFRTLVVEKK